MRKTLALYNYKKQDGTIFNICIINGVLTGADAYIYDSVTDGWNPQGLNLNIDEDYNFVTFLDRCFLLSKSNTPITYDGNEWSTTEMQYAPRARFGCVYHERLYLFNTNHGNSRMEWSSLPIGNQIDWTSTDYEEIGQDDGDEITYASTLGNRIIILKRYSMWAYDGSTLRKIANIGTSAPRSVVQFRDVMYFYCDEAIWAFDGSNLNKITENIEDIIRDVDNSDTAVIQYSGGGGISGRYYYLYVGDLVKNDIVRAMIVVDLITEKYSVFSIRDTPTTFCQSTIQDIPYMTFGTTESEIMYFDDSTSDNNDAIESICETKAFDLGKPDTLKQFNHIIVSGSPVGFQIGYRLDNIDEVHQLGYVSKQEQKFYFPKNCKGYRISLRITEVSEDTAWKFDGFSLDYTELGVMND